MKKFFLIAGALLSLTACSLDDNLSPNDPLIDQASPVDKLAAAQTSVYDAQSTDIMSLSNIWMNCWAGNEYYFAAPMTSEYQMNITAAFRGGVWNNNFMAMRNPANIIRDPKAAEYPHQVAIAKVLLANSMQYIVDFYGDAPYSEAWLGNSTTPTPKFDKGQDIYKSLVLSLNEAIAAFNGSAGDHVVAGEDVILNGDIDGWKKVANTIKLRLLLRQSNVTDASVKAFVDAQLASLVGASFVDTDVLINPGYSNATNEQLNPLYREYGFQTFDGTAQNTYGYRYMGNISDHFAKLLNGDDANTGVADPRRAKMYRAVGGKLVGIVQGGGKVSGAAEANFSRLAWKYYAAAATNGSMDGYFMTVSESEFLQAEAAVLYPALFSNAKAHYDAGVQANFAFFGATIGSYLTSIDTKPYGWNGSKGQIAAIQYQRMVALNMVKPQETYINYLKTGYPETPLALTAVHPNKPWRLVYPQREYNTNSANVPNVTEADCFVKNNLTPFWNR